MSPDAELAMQLLKNPDVGPPPVDMGPGARASLPQPSAPLPGMRPTPKPDEVSASDVQASNGHDLRRFLQGRNDQITVPGAREHRDVQAHREDPIANDPLAGAIAQGIPAAGAGMLMGAATRALAPASPLLSRVVQGAATGAVATPEHPIRGAVVGGAIPGVPGLIGKADNALGEAALSRVTAPAAERAGGTLSKAVDIAGGAVGTTVGHRIGGIPGAVAGGVIGSQARKAVTAGVDSIAERLAARHMARLDALRSAGERAAVPTAVAEEVTVPEKYVPIQKTAEAKVAELAETDPFKNSQPSARMSPAERGASQGSLEDQLQRSVEIMGDLRVAQRTGTLTPDMVQKAIDSGISPTAVYHIVGDKVAAHAAVKKAITGE